MGCYVNHTTGELWVNHFSRLLKFQQFLSWYAISLESSTVHLKTRKAIKKSGAVYHVFVESTKHVFG